MNRNIASVNAPLAPAPPAANQGAQDYLDRLHKIIPTEVAAAYLAISSLLTDTIDPLRHGVTLLVFAIFLTIITPFYLWVLAGVRNKMQLVVSTLSFPVWAVCISTSMVALAFPSFSPETITVIMVAWVLVTPLLVRP